MAQPDPHFHKFDRISMKDIIPDDTVLEALPVSAEEGRMAVVESGGSYSFYQFLQGAWRTIGGITVPLPVASGGTGAITAAGARANLSAASAVHTHAASDIASGTIDTARLGSGSADATKYLRGDQTWQTFPAAETSKVSIVTSDVTVANTTTETNLLSITIPAGTLGTNNAVRVRLHINNFDNAGTGNSITLRVKYGGTTQLTNAGFEVNANQVYGFIDVYIFGDGATNAQEMTALLDFKETLIDQNPVAAPNGINDYVGGTGAIDSTVDQTLVVSVEWNLANAANSITMDWAIVEKIN